MLSITDAIKADFKQDRIDRQINKEKIVYDSIKTSNKSLLYKNINKKALNKIIIDLKLNLDNEFIDACNNTKFPSAEQKCKRIENYGVRGHK